MSSAPRARATAAGTAPGSAAASVPGRGENGKTCRYESGSASTSATVARWSASRSPGKPVRTSAPTQAPGRRRAAASDDVAISGRAVGPAHRGEETIRAALERQVEVRTERGRDVRVREEVERELRGLDRRQPQARAQAPRDGGADEVRERAARREIPPVRPEVNTGEDDLRVSPAEEREAAERLVEGERARAAACERHDAVAAAGVAAVLDLEERPRVAGEDERRLPPARRVPVGRAEADEPRDRPRDLRLRARPDDRRDPGQRREHVGSQLRVAAGSDDARARMLARGAPDRLPRRGVGVRRDRARVHHDDVGALAVACDRHPVAERARDRVGVGAAHPAAERDQRHPRLGPRPLRRCGHRRAPRRRRRRRPPGPARSRAPGARAGPPRPPPPGDTVPASPSCRCRTFTRAATGPGGGAPATQRTSLTAKRSREASSAVPTTTRASSGSSRTT